MAIPVEIMDRLSALESRLEELGAQGGQQSTVESTGARSIASYHLQDDAVTAAKVDADVAGAGLVQAAGGELDVQVDDATLQVASDIVKMKLAPQRFLWADTPVLALNLTGQTASIGYTDLTSGLTPTSGWTMDAVALRLQIGFTTGPFDVVGMKVRKNGAAHVNCPELVAEYANTGEHISMVTPVGVDASKVYEYAFDRGSQGTYSLEIYELGHWETYTL